MKTKRNYDGETSWHDTIKLPKPVQKTKKENKVLWCGYLPKDITERLKGPLNSGLSQAVTIEIALRNYYGWRE